MRIHVFRTWTNEIIFFLQNREYLPNMCIHVFEVFGHVNKDFFFLQNKEYPPNMCIHVFEAFRTWTTKLNIFLIKIENTSQIRVFMYLGYSEHEQPK